MCCSSGFNLTPHMELEWSRGFNTVYCRCLYEYHQDLIQIVIPEDICEELYALEVLNHHFYQFYTNRLIPGTDRNTLLLNRIPGEPNGFLGFLLALSIHTRYTIVASAIWARYKQYVCLYGADLFALGTREAVVELALRRSRREFNDSLVTFPQIDVQSGEPSNPIDLPYQGFPLLQPSINPPDNSQNLLLVLSYPAESQINNASPVYWPSAIQFNPSGGQICTCNASPVYGPSTIQPNQTAGQIYNTSPSHGQDASSQVQTNQTNASSHNSEVNHPNQSNNPPPSQVANPNTGGSSFWCSLMGFLGRFLQNSRTCSET